MIVERPHSKQNSNIEKPNTYTAKNMIPSLGFAVLRRYHVPEKAIKIADAMYNNLNPI
jgi:hypothetical protein